MAPGWLRTTLLGRAEALSSVVQRSGAALLVVWALVTLVFLALRLLPGDPTALILGDQASEAARAALRSRLGYDRSLGEQYLRFLLGMLTLDFGESLRRPGVSAISEVRAALGPTAQLAFLATTLGAIGGTVGALLAVGPWLGRGRVWAHRAAMAGGAVPLLVLAPVVTYLFSVRWRLLPLPGDPDGGFAGLLLAASLLGMPLGAQVARVARAALIDLGKSRFLDTAAAKGASPTRVWTLHALPVVSGPISVVVSTQLGALLGGAVVLERLFERPGLGSLMLGAYAARDLPVLEASVAAAGLLFVAVQGVAAWGHRMLDPRGGAAQ